MSLRRFTETMTYVLVVFVLTLTTCLVYENCHMSHVFAETRDRRAAKGLVGEADENTWDYKPVLRVFAKKASDIARGAEVYSSIFKPILPSTPPHIALRRRAILGELSPQRRRQIDLAERAVGEFRHGHLAGPDCDPDEEGDRDGDTLRMIAAGNIQVDCGPECHLPRTWPTCTPQQNPERDHCDPPGCVVNRFWRHPEPGETPPPRAIPAALARGRRGR